MNNIQGAFLGISQSFKNYCYTTQQATMSVVWNLKNLRNDTEVFLKVCQVAFASLQLIIMRYPGAASLSRFSFALSTAGMHDFYRFLQQPRQWFFPITWEAIDENLVLEDLTCFVCQKLNNQPDEMIEEENKDTEIFSWAVETADSELSDNEEENKIEERVKQINHADFEKLHTLLRNCLKAQLQAMHKNGDAYRNLGEFKDVVQRRLHNMKEVDFNKYEFNQISLQALKAVDFSDLNEKNPNYHVAKWIRHVPLAERITNLNWSIVDIGCVGLYLQGWELLDTAKWAEKIGQYPVFQWVKNHQLDTWVIGLVCTAFSWKLFEALRKLLDEELTAQEKRRAIWNVFTSVAELALFGAIFLNHIGQTKFNNVHLQWLAIGARSLGTLSIVTRPEHEFFQQPEGAPAA
jgi:hypothetical protein